MALLPAFSFALKWGELSRPLKWAGARGTSLRGGHRRYS